VWKDETQADGMSHDIICKRTNLSFSSYDRATLNESDRRKKTLERAETMVQAMIWSSARKLRNPNVTMETG